MSIEWANSVDLHLDLDAAGGRRQALEQALREAIRSGRLAPQTRLPSTRALAAGLHLARNTVAAAYEQLTAEGYLSARVGSGTEVAGAPLRSAPAAPPAAPAAPRFDLRPGSPEVGTFPVDAWLRATRRALAAAPVSAFDYGDPRGRPELRAALATYLGRARGVLADPEHMIICSGYVQALGLLARTVGGPFAMEDPGLPFHREVVRHHGAEVLALPVDDLGARTDLLGRDGLAPARAAVLTPAHQYPMGVTLHPARRRAAVAWAAAHDALVIEDDYDGEFRYDRQPVGALQAMSPEHVVYVGTAAKTLGPALRLAWLVLPERLVAPLAAAKRLADLHTETIGQLALADLIGTHDYDRHVRSCRLNYRRRRDLLIDRLGRRHQLHGIAAGMHALISLPPGGPTESEVVANAAARGLAVGALGPHRHHPTPAAAPGLIIGYATPSRASYPAAVDILARTLHGL
ncbi:MocR-like pyridoxine biosynthesis transcription factor PdxR [Catellatospora tritici]|uniref:MocR-like pyridoxine biosynthesis transcription factor PdxR n=1 Tax=Catellatospora tritici TaxID=2851566 RepID=UPI001C2CDEB3|nr:PLP-dependent aminotransferase family protein [Catellatospora tritici]MBV1853705.1 PLP-dependent aminotransferase family protein [Catellatospora tritici]